MVGYIKQLSVWGLMLLFALGHAHEAAGNTDLSNPGDAVPALNAQQETSVRNEQAPVSGNAIDPDEVDEDVDFLDDDFDEDSAEIADPLYYWNVTMYHFNDKFYFWVLKPVAQGYKAVAPEIVRQGVKNFFYNLTTPVRLVSCVLQGKMAAAFCEVGRFSLNTTAGVLGFGNPAKRFPELTPPAEDMGQTLGVYGIGNGFYLVWPFIGPSTLRDTAGLVGDTLLDPVHYMEPTEAAIAVRAFDTVNKTSFRIGDYEAFKDAAFDPYTAIKNAYIQRRDEKIKE